MTNVTDLNKGALAIDPAYKKLVLHLGPIEDDDKTQIDMKVPLVEVTDDFKARLYMLNGHSNMIKSFFRCPTSVQMSQI